MANCNSNAGAEILKYFQKRWQTIHAMTADNANLADNIASAIDSIVVGVDKQDQMLNGLAFNLSALTGKNSVINEIQSTLDECLVNCKVLEELLIEKEQTLIREQINKSFDVNYRMKIYEGKQKKDSEIKIKSIKDNHEKKMKELMKQKVRKEEQIKKREEDILKERQRTFNEVFQSEVDQFKKEGVINRPINTPASASLAEVVVEVDEEEKQILEQFLED